MSRLKIPLTLVSSVLLITSSFAKPGPEGKGRRGPPPVAEIIADFDQNGTQSLSEDELAAFLTHKQEERAARKAEQGKECKKEDCPDKPEPAELSVELIEAFDDSGDGALDEQELDAALRELHDSRRKGKQSKGRGERRGPPPAE